MPADKNVPSLNDRPQPGNVPPRLSSEPNRKTGSWRQLFALLLSLCLGLFLVDGLLSLLDDSLILFFGLHALSVVRGLTSILATLMVIGIYGLTGLTPMVPKRLFLPLSFFILATVLSMFPFAIYYHGWLLQFACVISAGQIILGLGLLYLAQGGLKFRWPLISVEQLNPRGFNWRNLAVFALANIFVLMPVILIYLFVCSTLAVDHFSDGFMALRPDGFTVQVRKYVRDDGKTIELFPMAHVADASFYQKVSQTFPTNSIILMEGVTDTQNLLTNKLTYQRMAKTLGLSEQHEKFTPTHGLRVRADVDIAEFSKDTIDLLNLVTLVHVKGLNPKILLQLLQYAPPPDFEERIMDDILTKRNDHLLSEIQSHLTQTDSLMVPWGVAHMPGIAREIQKFGFRLGETKEYRVISFHGAEK
jgi:hypothetical protein